MSTWEERMSARAQERIRAEQERERVRQEEEWAAHEAALDEQYRPIREAGPPGGCHACWSWEHWGGTRGWWHRDSAEPGPPPDGSDISDSPADWCWHACHGDEAPIFCGPIAFAAAG